MEQRTAKVIPFPGPRQKTLIELAEPSQPRFTQASPPIRQLSSREVDHRRRMLLHLTGAK